VDTFYAVILGTGGHGAYPHHTIDPIYLTTQALNALYAIVGRRIDPVKPCVISVGSVHGGAADSVIPAQVELCGTIRSHDEATRARLIEEMEHTLAVARALGGDYRLRIVPGYPVAYDAPTLAELMRNVAGDLLGGDNLRSRRLLMGAEDFGILTLKAQQGGAMLLLGTAGDESTQHPNHSPHFNIDERALPIGAAVLAETALRYLNHPNLPQGDD
jgi:amidohydrolase